MQTPAPSKHRKMFWILIALVIALVLLPFVGAAFVVDDWSRDLTTNTAETDVDAADESMRPLATSSDFDQIEQAAKRIAQESSDWEFATADPAEQTLHLIHISGLFNFRDDVKLRVESLPHGQQVHVRSQSRIGKGDLGQNPRNIRDIHKRLRSKLGD